MMLAHTQHPPHRRLFVKNYICSSLSNDDTAVLSPSLFHVIDTCFHNIHQR